MDGTITTHRVVFQPAGSMDGIESNSIALVVTSPPYPMIEMWDACFSAQDAGFQEALSSNDAGGAFDRAHDLLATTWRGLARVLMPGGIACINIGDATRTIGDTFHLFPNHARVIDHCRAAGLQSLPGITWRKPTNAPTKFMGSGMLPPCAYVTLEQEHVLVFRKGDKRAFTTTDAKARRRASAYFWEERNAWFSDTWDVKGVAQDMPGDAPARARSAAFPLELACRLVHMFSIKGDTVLDPFVGTGTTAIAAIAGARLSIGFERDPSLAAMIDASLARAMETCNAWNAARLERHASFITKYTREKGKPKHLNEHHGFPVITSQETGIRLDQVLAVSRHGQHHEATHVPWPAKT